MIKTAAKFWREFFITNPKRSKPILLLIAVVGFELFTVFLNVQFNEWRNGFYNSLQNVDQDAFYYNIKKFLALAIVFVAVVGYKTYISQKLQGLWRKWMTHQYLAKWTHDKAYYGSQFITEAADNADQRIAEDVRSFVIYSMSLTIGLLSACVTFFSFIYILWTLSDVITMSAFGFSLAIGHYLVWLALIYACVGTWITHKIGRPLVGLNFEQQMREADFRFNLMRTKENAEAIAMYNGEDAENIKFKSVYDKLYTNYQKLITKQKHLTWWASYYGQIAVVFPYIISAPKFFAKTITLGTLMQTASAFDSVQSALSWIVDSYANIAEYKAVMQRLSGLDHTFVEWTKLTASKNIVVKTGKNFGFVKLSINLPNGQLLLNQQSMKFAKGKRYIISGASGVGKSTVIRSLANIWPYASGTITTQQNQQMMFISQQTYIPHGTLLDALTYPSTNQFLVKAEKLLIELDMQDFLPQLLESKHWDKILSGGQKQKLAFIRAILCAPDVLFLDESTSNMDQTSEQRAYQLLAKYLPETTIISVGHKTTVEKYHDTKLVIKDKAIKVCRKNQDCFQKQY